MEQNLINDDLIRYLCAIQDEALSLQYRQQGVGAEARNAAAGMYMSCEKELSYFC